MRVTSWLFVIRDIVSLANYEKNLLRFKQKCFTFSFPVRFDLMLRKLRLKLVLYIPTYI